MKTTFRKSIFSLALFGALSTASLPVMAENLRMNVPFEFSAAGKRLPAGEYVISEMPGADHVMYIEKTDKSPAKAMIFGRVVGTPAMPGKETKTGVTFKKDALVGVTAFDHVYELNSPAAPAN